VALNIAAFPETLPPPGHPGDLPGAAAVVAEAGGVDRRRAHDRSPEPIFGLAVQGLVRPGAQFTTGGARPGDALVLSKPLGTGLALRAGDEAGGGRLRSRACGRLNRDAARPCVPRGRRCTP
jgi:selenide,water dikinase